jgi:hypothetical protein
MQPDVVAAEPSQRLCNAPLYVAQEAQSSPSHKETRFNHVAKAASSSTDHEKPSSEPAEPTRHEAKTPAKRRRCSHCDKDILVNTGGGLCRHECLPESPVSKVRRSRATPPPTPPSTPPPPPAVVPQRINLEVQLKPYKSHCSGELVAVPRTKCNRCPLHRADIDRLPQDDDSLHAPCRPGMRMHQVCCFNMAAGAT